MSLSSQAKGAELPYNSQISLFTQSSESCLLDDSRSLRISSSAAMSEINFIMSIESVNKAQSLSNTIKVYGVVPPIDSFSPASTGLL